LDAIWIDAIVQHLADNTSETDRAVQLCDALSHNSFEDWFLTSKDVLNAIWDNIVDDDSGSKAVLVGLPMIPIGRRPRSVVTACGSSTSAMASRAPTPKTPTAGFGLCGLFKYLPI